MSSRRRRATRSPTASRSGGRWRQTSPRFASWSTRWSMVSEEEMIAAIDLLYAREQVIAEPAGAAATAALLKKPPRPGPASRSSPAATSRRISIPPARNSPPSRLRATAVPGFRQARFPCQRMAHRVPANAATWMVCLRQSGDPPASTAQSAVFSAPRSQITRDDTDSCHFRVRAARHRACVRVEHFRTRRVTLRRIHVVVPAIRRVQFVCAAG